MSRTGTIEAEFLELQFLDEGIHNARGVVFRDEVIETLRQQSDLSSVFSLDESLHVALSASRYNIAERCQAINSFLHSLAALPPLAAAD